MMTCKLGDKKYHIPQISGRALREMEPALEAYGQIAGTVNAAGKGEQIPETKMSLQDAYDRLVTWFCVVFGNQFTPDMVYDLYPADRMTHDLMLLLMSVIQARTEVLSLFPTAAAAEKP